MPEAVILTLSCPDAPGIVAQVSGFIASQGLNIVESAQFFDRTTGDFFMRVVTEGDDAAQRSDALAEAFRPIAEARGMRFRLVDRAARTRTLIMVSRFGHCLNDLLFRHSIGALPIEIPLVVSNHWDSYQRVAAMGIPYHHVPVTKANKAQQEARLAELVEEHRIDLIVLARYMQVLSPEMCRAYSGRIINIHHSFLPSFKGAKPYHQAHARGVKLIGATAHYVTEDLDEGPIIEQDAVRADHSVDPDELAATGRDVEAVVLARALRYHCEHRVLLNGHKTVVFR
jgi:formyltetrahydrofolate deformylase